MPILAVETVRRPRRGAGAGQRHPLRADRRLLQPQAATRSTSSSSASRRAWSTSTGPRAPPPAPGRACSRSAAGRAAARPARTSAGSTPCPATCASRAGPWCRERACRVRERRDRLRAGQLGRPGATGRSPSSPSCPGPRPRADDRPAPRSTCRPSLIHVYPLMVARAAGCMVEDVDGNVFLDCQAGVSAASTGHCHPQVAAAMAVQAENLIHICGTDFYYPSYGELCEKLAEHGARGCERVGGRAGRRRDGWQTFLTNSGTEGVEAAIKLARHHTKRAAADRLPGRLPRAQPGLAVADRQQEQVPQALRAAAAGRAPRRVRQPGQHRARSVPAHGQPRGRGGHRGRAGAGRRRLHRAARASSWPGCAQLCDRHGILLVFDEVQSGMGRTGTMFAAEHFGVVPDIFVLAKGLASGMPLGAMMARRSVHDLAAGLARLDLRRATRWPSPRRWPPSPAGERAAGQHRARRARMLKQRLRGAAGGRRRRSPRCAGWA